LFCIDFGSMKNIEERADSHYTENCTNNFYLFLIQKKNQNINK
jgi:hypothetical protein